MLPTRASFSLRLAGLLVDIGLSFVFGIIFAIIFGFYSYSFLEPIQTWAGNWKIVGAVFGYIVLVIGPFIGIAVGVSLSLTVNSLIETISGATLGKVILGLRVGDLVGKPASQKALWKRWAVKNSPTICFLISFLTPLTFFAPLGALLPFVVFFGSLLALSSKRQTLHDYLAGTAVYKQKEMQ